MEKKLFTKKIDKSLLKAGLTVPTTSCDDLVEALHVPLKRGEKTDIDIVIDGILYRATFTHVDMKKTNRDVYQIRYSENSPICIALKNVFRSPELAEDESSCIEVWSSGTGSIEFRCVTASIKDAFMKYLGPDDSLYGYQKSYKLVFYKSYFAEAFYDERISVDLLTRLFRQFYIDRKRSRLPVEIGVIDRTILNAEKSSVEDFYALILKNPFNAVNKKGFFLRQVVDGKTYFTINKRLYETLSEQDLDTIRNLVFRKLKLYYSKDRIQEQMKEETAPASSVPPVKEGLLRQVETSRLEPKKDIGLYGALTRVVNEYQKASEKPLTGNSLARFIRKDLPEAFFETGLVNAADHRVVGSAGQGTWATIPWLCIFDRSITTTAQEGVYIVYLLSKDTDRLYLTFNQGCTNLRKAHSKRETIQLMRQEADRVIKRIDSRGFRTDEDINLGEGLTELGELYQKGTIFYKEYRKGNLPEESVLRADLSKMLDIYADYAHPHTTVVQSVAKEPAWLLTWNPQQWNWNDYAAGIEASRSGEKYEVTWSCSNTHVKPGDRMYLMILGNNGVRGIIASGKAISKAFEVPHWDPQKAKTGKKTNSVRVSFEKILDFRSDAILSLGVLQESFPDQKWNPQGSGIEIHEKYAGSLQAMWEEIAGRNNVSEINDLVTRIKRYAEEIDSNN